MLGQMATYFAFHVSRKKTITRTISCLRSLIPIGSLSRQDFLDGLALLLVLLNLSPILELLGVRLSSVNAEHLGTLLAVVSATKDSIHVLKRDTLSLRDTEPDENAKQDVDAKEEEETLEAGLGKEGREELLEDGVGHILALRGHTNSLGSDIGGEDFTSPHPDTSTP